VYPVSIDSCPSVKTVSEFVTVTIPVKGTEGETVQVVANPRKLDIVPFAIDELPELKLIDPPLVTFEDKLETCPLH
jgi:hypothetical protein